MDFYQPTRSDKIYDELREGSGVYIKEGMSSYTEWKEGIPKGIRTQVGTTDPNAPKLDEVAERYGLSTSGLISTLSQATPVNQRDQAAEELKREMMNYYGVEEEDMEIPTSPITSWRELVKWIKWGPVARKYRSLLYRRAMQFTGALCITVLVLGVWVFNTMYDPVKPLYTLKEIERQYPDLIGRTITVKTPIAEATLWKPKSYPGEEKGTDGIIFMNSFVWDPWNGRTKGFMLVSFRTELWPKLKKLQGKMVTIRGQLKLWKFSPEIIINSMDQIKKVEEWEGKEDKPAVERIKELQRKRQRENSK